MASVGPLESWWSMEASMSARRAFWPAPAMFARGAIDAVQLETITKALHGRGGVGWGDRGDVGAAGGVSPL
jgi:hypothetical protein